LKGPYAPLGERLAALRQHLAGYSGYLEAARDNLEASLPRPNLQIAIEAAAGQSAYLDGEVRTAAAGDADTLQAIDRAVRETRAAVDFLKQRQRDAHDHFALGEDRFLRLLQNREPVPETVAAMDSAGPLETVPTESYYYVTVPAADWSETSREQWLRHLNYAMLENVSIHEAYPGHFVQSLHERRVGSRTRQLFWSYANVEGFAHYVEEM